jgi:hypothetical protein
MTLVVSDISKHGIVMVGDSAITQIQNGRKEVRSGCAKIHYSSAANIGFATWGNAGVGKIKMDTWISEFIQTSIKQGEDLDEVATKIKNQLNPILSSSGLTWKQLHRGIHIAGYKNGLPCLYHIHCGHDNEPSHELRFYKDYPDDQNWSKCEFKEKLNSFFIHLRSGYRPLFGLLFDRILDYSKQLRGCYNISFPFESLNHRLEFYKLLVKFVAGVLVASNHQPMVSDILSSIAFTENGLVIDQQIKSEYETEEGEDMYSTFF